MKHKLPCFVLCAFLNAFPLAAHSQQNIALDFGSFRYDSAKTYTEIYYAIPIAELNFAKTSTGMLQAQALVRLSIYKDDAVWKTEEWRLEKTAADSSQIQAGNRMVDLARYLLAPGTYRVAVHLEDLHDAKNVFQTEKELRVADFLASPPSLSDIQFAAMIKSVSSDSSSLFYKNGLEVIPAPSAMYGKGAPLLYYYLEAYDLSKIVSGAMYKTRCQIADASNVPLSTLKAREQIKNKTAEASVEVGALNVSTLPSGIYHFQFDVLDIHNSPLSSAAKKFYIYNPDLKANAPALVESSAYNNEFAAMAEKELDADFELAKYIASREEKKSFASLKNPAGKRQYLAEFWQRKDPAPATAVNEFRKEYQRRAQHANENFYSYTRKGWKTDRGRIYMLYGSPNDVERFPNNPVSYSYEIWHYDDIEGGVIFVFADLQEYGEFTQLHSTKRGEPMNAGWERRIQKN